MRAEKMTSDTVLTWETNMETPSQHLSTSTDKVSSVGGGLSTPPRPLKSSQVSCYFRNINFSHVLALSLEFVSLRILSFEIP